MTTELQELTKKIDKILKDYPDYNAIVFPKNATIKEVFFNRG